MAKKAVVDAVEKRLADLWASPAGIDARAAAGLPECPVFGINLQGDVPGDGSVFAQVQYPVSMTKQMDLAGRVYRESGSIRLIVNAQRGSGISIGQALAERMADLFRGKKFDGVQTFAPSSPAIDDRNDNGLFFPMSIAVPYQFDFTDETGFYA